MISQQKSFLPAQPEQAWCLDRSDVWLSNLLYQSLDDFLLDCGWCYCEGYIESRPSVNIDSDDMRFTPYCTSSTSSQPVKLDVRPSMVNLESWYSEQCITDLVNNVPFLSSSPLTKELGKEIIRRISFCSVSYKRILDYHYEKMMIQVFRKICNHDGQYFLNQCDSIGSHQSRRSERN